MRRIYLDANGASPPSKAASAAILKALDLRGNASAFHEHGRSVRGVIDEARHHVALGINAQAKEIIFTSGASEANRLFVDALIDYGARGQKSLNVVMSPFEHPSLLKPVMRAHSRGQISLTIMETTASGAVLVSPEALSLADVIIVTHAHNETGIISDITNIMNHARSDAIIMSDISQAYARLDPVPERVDVLAMSAQKMGGFAGVGALLLRGHAKVLPPPWLGGGQERGFRPGTESALLIAAFGAAASEVSAVRKIHQEQAQLRDYFEDTLASFVPMRVIGNDMPRLPNTSAISFFKETEPDAMRIACDMAGLSVGFGSACSGLAPEGSFALKRLGLGLMEEKATIRFSFPVTMTRLDVDEAIDRLLSMVLSHKFRA